eukprot:gene694-1330_t
MASSYQLTAANEGISCHAWNHDRGMLALCPNNNEIHIYGECHGPNWQKLHVLREHDLLVSAIDWSSVHNKIVSCSHDRNAFVWTYDPASSEWKPALVILHVDRAALDVRWSIDGLRFAVASGSKCVPVCSYEEKNNWWISKTIKKKFKSSVICVAFHPTNGQVLATGSTDFKCRVYSTFNSEVDVTPNATPFLAPLEFGELFCEFSCVGWVQALAWSPSGNTLCYCCHDSTIHFASFNNLTNNNNNDPVVQSLRLSCLPLTSLLFLSENAVVAGGHDFVPVLLGKSGGVSEWSMLTGVTDGLDPGTRGDKSTSGIGAGSPMDRVASARALFQNKSVRGLDLVEESLGTQHERPIIALRAHSLQPLRFSSSALDGRLVVWDVKQLQPPHAALAALSI